MEINQKVLLGKKVKEAVIRMDPVGLQRKKGTIPKKKVLFPFPLVDYFSFFIGACDGETTSVTNIVLCVLLKEGVPRRVAPLISEDFFFLLRRLYAGSIPHARNNA